MYDLIDIIDIKLSGMDRLIHRWMTNHQLIKSTLLHDIKSIKMTINKYHKKYVICKEWENYGRCKYGTYCWNLHPLNNNNNNNINNSNNSNNSNKQKRKENKQKISEKKINFPEFSDKNENGSNNSIGYYSDNNNNSLFNYSDNDSSDDSDYKDDKENFQDFSQKQKFQEFSHQNNERTYRNSDNGNKRELSPDYQPVKRKKKKKKKKSKKWRKKEAVKKEITQAKNFFCNKDKLQKMMDKTDNIHIKYLIQHYKQPICFKYMNGRCNDTNCTFKHPKKCDNYKHNNGYKCKHGDKCWFAHINFKQQPNGTVVTNYENINKNKNYNKKDNNNNKKNSNNNDNKLNNNQNNKNYTKIEKELDQRVQELKKEKYSVTGVNDPNFSNIGKVSNDKTYCEVVKDTSNKQDNNKNEETKDNDNNNEETKDNNQNMDKTNDNDNESYETENNFETNDSETDDNGIDNSVRYNSEPEINLDDYTKDENGNILYDTLDEYLILTEKKIPCKKRNSNMNEETKDDIDNNNSNDNDIQLLANVSNEAMFDMIRRFHIINNEGELIKKFDNLTYQEKIKIINENSKEVMKQAYDECYNAFDGDMQKLKEWIEKNYYSKYGK